MPKRLEDLLADQRRRWHAGEPRPVEQYLADDPSLAGNDEAAVDLIYQEYVLRSELGPPPAPAEYFHRFPHHRDALDAQLTFLHAVQALAVKLTRAPAKAPSTCPGLTAAPTTPTGASDWPCLEGYEVLAELGRGSMGVVYQARQRNLGRLVALKMIHPTRAREPEAQARFRQEAAAVARLQHPHIVQIHEIGEQDGRLYFAMELVDGMTLERSLAGAPLSDRQAAQLAETLARTIHHAHERGVVHRDLKPANILLQTNPTTDHTENTDKKQTRISSSVSSVLSVVNCVLKITDFGLARCGGDDLSRLTETGAVLGTPSYMAPEQADGGGRAVGPAADVYALGAILYECLTGRPPFRAATPLETLRQAVSDEPLPPSRLQPKVPRNLDTICLKCLEKAPERRYESARALADDLGRHLRGEPIQARPVSVAERGWRWCQRNPGLAGMAALLVLALLGGLGGILYQWRQAEDARREAETSEAGTQELIGELIQSYPALPLRRYSAPGVPPIEALLKAEAHSERLLQKHPDDVARRITLTRLQGGLANYYVQHARSDEAENCLRQARELWEPLVRNDPRNRDYRTWMATTLDWHGIWLDTWGKHRQGLEAAQRAEVLWEELLDEQPGNLTLLQHMEDNRGQQLSLIKSRPGREALLRPLEDSHDQVERELHASPANTLIRKRLAMICVLLAEVHFNPSAPAEVSPYWREAAEHYRRLAAACPDDPTMELCLARCGYRLMQGQAEDPYYGEAVAHFAHAAEQLAPLQASHPDSFWLQETLLDARFSVALCHWKAGQPALAEQAYRSQVQRLDVLLEASATQPRKKLFVLTDLLIVASALREAGKRDAALAVIHEAATLAVRCADFPVRDVEFSGVLAGAELNVSITLRQLGHPEEALLHGEQARHLFEGLCRADPDTSWFPTALSDACQHIGKAHWALGHTDEALAALREAAVLDRKVFDQAPSIPASRLNLSRCYDRLAYWSALAGRFGESAAALREREKLWSNDPDQLRKVVEDFRDLANRATEQAERQQYLEESERVERAIAALERR